MEILIPKADHIYQTINSGGCDSIVTLNLIITDHIERSDTINICEGDSVKIFGNWISEEGDISETFTGSAGCDSIQTYNVSVNPLPKGQINSSICEGDSVFIIDRWFDTAGTYTVKKANTTSCDSLIDVNIAMIKNKISYDTLRLCRGDTLIINGEIITTQSDLQKKLTSAEHCDSLVYVHVRMLEPTKSENEVKLCPGDSLYIAGNWINTEDKVEEIYLGSNGCDSTAITNIRLIAEPEEPKMEIDCESGEINLSISATDDWQIHWDNGSNSEQTTYKDKPDAKVQLTAIEGCERQFTITLPQIPNITLIKHPGDTTINSTETLKIDLGLDLSEWEIVWTPNGALDCDTCSQVNITIDQNTEFVIYLKHTSGCDYQIKFRVNIEKSKLNIPNIFSPDGDRHNDNWEIKLPPGIEIRQCSIYDRWGERIYSRSGTIHWDGTFKGKKAMSGVYVYVIEYIENGEKMFITGDVTLVR